MCSSHNDRSYQKQIFDVVIIFSTLSSNFRIKAIENIKFHYLHLGSSVNSHYGNFDCINIGFSDTGCWSGKWF